MKLSRIKNYVQEHGLRSSVVLTMDRMLHRQIPKMDYSTWLMKNRPSSRDYDKMEKSARPDGPVFGVMAAMEEKDRLAFMQSLDMQVYHKYRPLKQNSHVEYALVVGGACSLRPDLLWKCADLLMKDEVQAQKPDLIYFDSDRIGEDGCKGDPSFRPDYDPDLLSEVNYMGNAVVVKTDLLDTVGLPTDGKESYHRFLKGICRIGNEEDKAGAIVMHIPEILYHEVESAAKSAEEFVKDTAGTVEDTGFTNEDVSVAGDLSGFSEKVFSGQEDLPLVTVMIPNKDHIDDLERCITSLLEENTWKRLEILIIENNSEDEETFAYYNSLPGRDDRIKVLTWDGPFNYSAINNFGFDHAKGEYILLLNNDTKIIEKDSIGRMVCLARRPGIGAVGALLLYPGGTVQHGGIILGHGGIAGHAWEGVNPAEIFGSFQKLVFSHLHNVSAVTGACMMLKRSCFEAAGRFDEDLGVTFNDVDLCLQLRKRGLRVLMCPGAQLIHYESASRGSEDSPEKVMRFHREIDLFVHRWEKELAKGDPFYNPNLTLVGESWTYRDSIREPVKPYLKYLHMND